MIRNYKKLSYQPYKYFCWLLWIKSHKVNVIFEILRRKYRHRFPSFFDSHFYKFAYFFFVRQKLPKIWTTFRNFFCSPVTYDRILLAADFTLTGNLINPLRFLNICKHRTVEHQQWHTKWTVFGRNFMILCMQKRLKHTHTKSQTQQQQHHFKNTQSNHFIDASYICFIFILLCFILFPFCFILFVRLVVVICIACMIIWNCPTPLVKIE